MQIVAFNFKEQEIVKVSQKSISKAEGSVFFLWIFFGATVATIHRKT
jgi:F420-0:gamma-glutamyl ligase